MKKAEKIEYLLSGYVKAESYTDTRQTTAIPEEGITDLYPYFPLDQLLDPTGQDIYGIGQTQLDVFDSRLRANINNIKMDKAVIDALFETNIFAISLAVPHIFIIRHACINAEWERATFTCGLTNHPIAFPIANPINYNGIVPFTLFARSTQCTYTYYTDVGLTLIASANSEIIFQSAGPSTINTQIFGVQFTENAIVPNFHVQARYKKNDYIVGAGLDYSRVVPQIETFAGYATRKKLNSLIGTAYFLIDKPTFYMHNALFFGGNPVQYGAIGGYAVKKGSINPVTNERSYTNLNTFGAWTDMAKNMKKDFQVGLFAAFQKRTGASHKIEPNVMDAQGNILVLNIFGFATKVDITYRISPRILIAVGAMTFAIELEFTRAYYGTNNEDGRVIDTHPVSNARTVLASYYFF